MQFKSMPANIAFARVAVAAFASQKDFTLNDLEEIKVAVSEAITNAIVHGYNNETNHFITLSVTLTESGIEIEVEDQGRGIADINQAMQPAYSTENDRMGLGFVFMQSFMDDLSVQSTVDQGTTVKMFKKVKVVSGVPEH
jgi:stage II sporulation protein AB (anti-sigma F factor)